MLAAERVGSWMPATHKHLPDVVAFVLDPYVSFHAFEVFPSRHCHVRLIKIVSLLFATKTSTIEHGNVQSTETRRRQ